MSEVDRKRIAAVRLLEELGYRFDGSAWQPSCAEQPWPEADALHALLMDRADALGGCTESSPEEDELRSIVDALEAYEARRWPMGKVVGGKG